MDQLICASLSHTHYWYEVGMLKVLASMDQPGKVVLPAHCQLNRENELFLCPRMRLRNWSRETGSAVPSCVSSLVLHIQAE